MKTQIEVIILTYENGIEIKKYFQDAIKTTDYIMNTSLGKNMKLEKIEIAQTYWDEKGQLQIAGNTIIKIPNTERD